jgi:hypothetical protein
VSDMIRLDISDLDHTSAFREGVPMITRVSKIILPVADQQAALDFWTTGMGFELVRDDAYGNERWDRSQASRSGPAACPQPATGR